MINVTVSSLVGFSAGVLFGVMTIGFFISRLLRNIGVVDVFWGLGLSICAWVLALNFATNEFQWVFVGLVSLWALRLSGFIFLTRVLKGHRDSRYDVLEAKWGKWAAIKSLGQFYLQAALQVLLSLAFVPIFYGQEAGAFTWIHAIGIGLVIIGIIGETVADLQLYRFKQRQEKGICQLGLWSISRHPNYFFEWVIWVGFGVYALAFSNSILMGLFSVLSPLTLWGIVRYVTGPFTESLSRKKYGAEFEAYIRRVPMLLPFIGKKEF